jgi:hypothetical protein
LVHREGVHHEKLAARYTHQPKEKRWLFSTEKDVIPPRDGVNAGIDDAGLNTEQLHPQ